MHADIVFISVSGHDDPDALYELLSILARYDVRVLDLGRALTLDQAALSLLIELPEQQEQAPVLKDVLFSMHARGLSARFTPIDAGGYERWVQQHGRPRFVVTLLAESLTAEQLACVTRISREFGLSVESVRRLSGRQPLSDASEPVRAVVEFSLRGEVADPAAIRGALLDAAGQVGADIAFQVDSVFRRNCRLVAFDMDSTLIATEVIDELADRAGSGAEVRAVTERAMRGEMDFSESLRARVATLAGLPESLLAEVARELPLSPGAERVVRTLRRLGYRTAVLSGGFDYFGRALQSRLGLDHVYANRLEIEDGRLTGRIVGTIVDGARKAELLGEIAAAEGIRMEQVVAVGDGANDLPMLARAGYGIAYRAKPVVRRSAGHALSHSGLDGLLYLLGLTDRDIERLGAEPD